jgi:choline monooxygenase
VEDAKRATIQCPYHAWTYDLDGRLRSAPRSEREAGFESEALGLIALAVDRWGPFLFVNPDPAAAPLQDTLGALPDLVASAGVDVDALRFRARAESSYAANWKICCENFLECYHCQVAHPGLTKVIDVSPEAYRLEEDRWYSSQFGPVKEGWTGDFDPTGFVGHGQFHFLYPNLTINIVPGSPNISIGPVTPEGPERTHRFLDYFFAADAAESWIQDLLTWDGRVGAEDRALVERVQSGVRAGIADRGVLLHDERLIRHFDRLLLTDLE